MHSATERALTSRNLLEWCALAAAGLLFAAIEVWFAGDVGRAAAADSLRTQAAGNAALTASALHSELEKHRVVPGVLAQDPDVALTLRASTPEHLAAMNRRLEALGAGIGASAIYLIRADGLTIAASNWRESTTFVGANYQFRPYFAQATPERNTEYYALGTVSRESGLYLSRRIDQAGKPLGVVVVKVGFDAVEAAWARTGATVYVTDTRGIVLLSSMANWHYLTQERLSSQAVAAIRASLQFGEAPLTPLPLAPLRDRRLASDLVSVAGGPAYLSLATPVASTEWELHLLVPAQTLLDAGARSAYAMAIGATALIFAIAVLLLHRRHRALSRESAALATRAMLEREVAAKTVDLRASNEQLKSEIEERHRVESQLQLARDELGQANRLAMLGQISAGLAHEVNQPVAAIRSYADNAAALLERQNTKAVRENLGLIGQLTERIGTITETLRGFSRRATGEAGAVPVEEAVAGAILLVSLSAQRVGVRIATAFAEPGLRAWANRVRLEQVLVNLLQNALEAMEQGGGQSIEVQARAEAEHVLITVSDDGPGIRADVAAQLFTPFITSKRQGLGLGLVISKDIVEDLGGRLEVAARPSGGTAFTVRLRKAS